tara:strand:+ start:775 stop:1203 length:429 start_codon:yes stop_codon:yes gene_type:complete
MNHPYAQKIPRHHPQVQDRQMMVDGFQDFAFKAFHPKYEKSAAPLSKRRNGVGPVKNGEGVFFGNVPALVSSVPPSSIANRFAIGGVILVGSIVYANAISNRAKSLSNNTLKSLKKVSSLTAIRYALTGYLGYYLIQDFTQQ